ncbi:hypothetical protein [uncultured Arthrobacter sp.]|uniref:hypothetical protein n=1 Tax=uncultured Arthrobacter sp. TaxID=114050 RepID=UPI0028D13A08|nr:hypothetical protein [uncultured Arthrobacter sp.]
MPLDKPISTIAPAGYDQKLWDSIPSVRAQKHRGKHQTYVYGQSSADGTACIGCAWQTSEILTGATAVARHDADQGLAHNHDVWVAIEHGQDAGRCPCGSQPRHDPVSLEAESVRAELQEAPGAHSLNAEQADRISALSDEEINAAVRASTDDAFWEQYDAVRGRAIARLIRQLNPEG